MDAQALAREDNGVLEELTPEGVARLAVLRDGARVIGQFESRQASIRSAEAATRPANTTGSNPSLDTHAGSTKPENAAQATVPADDRAAQIAAARQQTLEALYMTPSSINADYFNQPI